ALVLALTVAGPAPLPRSPAGWLAVGGLVGIAAWSAISLAWAPLGGAAIQNVERLVLYLGALLLAIGTLRARGAVRAVEPALGAGVYLSYSRGAIAAGAVGLMVLVAAAPTRSQLWAAALALATAVAAGGCAAAFPGVASLEGTHPARVRDGAVALAILALL